MAASLFFTLVNRALGTSAIEPNARAYFYVNGTTTPLTVYTDADYLVPYGAYVSADADGTFPPVYYQGTDPYRLVLTDSDGVALPGYPQDDVPPISIDLTDASSIPFSPTETIPETDVQSAIEMVAALTADQSDLADRATSPWTTGGTGNAYTITPTPALSEYGTFLAIRVRPDRANTGAATLNVNAIGAKNIKKSNRAGGLSDLAAGDLQPQSVYDLIYDGTQFVVINILNVQASGYFYLPTGQMLAWSRMTISYDTSIALAATWTFPVAFSGSTPAVFVTTPTSDSGTFTGVNGAQLGSTFSEPSAASARVGVRIVSGSISAGASITNVNVFAIGMRH